MSTFRAYMLKKAYENVRKNGDKLSEAEKLLNWEAFRLIITPMYRNRGPRARLNVPIPHWRLEQLIGSGFMIA